MPQFSHFLFVLMFPRLNEAKSYLDFEFNTSVGINFRKSTEDRWHRFLYCLWNGLINAAPIQATTGENTADVSIDIFNGD